LFNCGGQIACFHGVDYASPLEHFTIDKRIIK